MSIFQTLAKLLGVPEHSAEDAIKSERLAHAVLTRRQALGGVAALVTGKAFGFGPQSTDNLRASILQVAIDSLRKNAQQVIGQAQWIISDDHHSYPRGIDVAITWVTAREGSNGSP